MFTFVVSVKSFLVLRSAVADPGGTVFMVAGGSGGCAELGGAEVLSGVAGGLLDVSGAGAGSVFLGVRAVPGGKGDGAGRPTPGASGIWSGCPDCCATACHMPQSTKATTRTSARLLTKGLAQPLISLTRSSLLVRRSNVCSHTQRCRSSGCRCSFRRLKNVL